MVGEGYLWLGHSYQIPIGTDLCLNVSRTGSRGKGASLRPGGCNRKCIKIEPEAPVCKSGGLGFIVQPCRWCWPMDVLKPPNCELYSGAKEYTGIGVIIFGEPISEIVEEMIP